MLEAVVNAINDQLDPLALKVWVTDSLAVAVATCTSFPVQSTWHIVPAVLLLSADEEHLGRVPCWGAAKARGSTLHLVCAMVAISAAFALPQRGRSAASPALPSSTPLHVYACEPKTPSDLHLPLSPLSHSLPCLCRSAGARAGEDAGTTSAARTHDHTRTRERLFAHARTGSKEADPGRERGLLRFSQLA